MPEGTFPVFQCETCIIPWKVGNSEFPTAFTFALRPDGTWFDPGDPADEIGDPGMN
jgi:hypothetical protein